MEAHPAWSPALEADVALLVRVFFIGEWLVLIAKLRHRP